MAPAVDASKPGLQVVELRIAGGGRFDNSRFRLQHDVAADMVTGEGKAVEDRVIGFYDGMQGAALRGWAWNPAHPDRPIEMELLVDGVRVAECVADGFRPDVRVNGAGHGRYGWRLPLARDPNSMRPLKIEIRPKGGAPLSNGVFELRNDLSLDDPANAALRPFVNSVLRDEPKIQAKARLPMPKTALLFYCPVPREAGEFWAREYDDYRAAMKGFARALAPLGDVFEVASVEEANRVCADRREKAEDCLLFSFGSLRQAPLNAACAVIPVFAWSFPSIPTGMWDGDRRSDWRYILRSTGRAIVLSEFAAKAVRAAMGADFPVAVVPAPIGRRAEVVASASLAFSREILIRGVVFDSRDHVLDANETELPAPVWQGEIPGLRSKTSIRVSGVLFTSVLEIGDGRENWMDLITAFAVANANNADATLLIKLSEPNPNWWLDMYRWLRLAPRFACRFIFARGDMDADDWTALVTASTWYVNVPKAAGLRTQLQGFLGAGRPAVSVTHTAMADYVAATNAVLIDADEEAWTWPDHAEKEGWSWTQHPADVGVTSRYRIPWSNISAALSEAYRISVSDPKRYAELSEGAARSMLLFCADEIVAAKVEDFIGPGSPSARAMLGPSALLREPPA